MNDDKIDKQDDEVIEESEGVDESAEQSGKTDLEKNLEEYENKYRRAIADYQNLEKRTREDKGELIKSANKDILLRLLPVLDTLTLAQEHVKDEGLRVSIQQFLDVLKSEGVTRIQVDGKDFDPLIMECVVIEKGKEGKVLAEVRAGYMLFDKLLRAAQVKVGSAEQN